METAEQSSKLLIFMRHGETALSRDGNRFCGDLDPDLTQHGIEQAEGAREAIAKISSQVDEAWTSPRRRAMQTAKLVLPGAEWKIFEDLRELSFGRWEGLTKEEARTLTPKAFDTWDEDAYHNAPPQGESGEMAAPRINNVLDAIAQSTSQTILIVSHITFLRWLVGLMMDIPATEIRKRIEMQTGKVGCIEVSSRKGKLKALNL